MTAVVDAAWNRVARPATRRARKSSFTIRIDQLFTLSREGAFTKAHHHPVKTPAIACVCRMRNAG
jgi:hypothetical protein